MWQTIKSRVVEFFLKLSNHYSNESMTSSYKRFPYESL